MAEFASLESAAISSSNYLSAVSHACMNSRKRSTMEDVHRITPVLGDANCSYFGVYDGHGGRKIVDFIETVLEENIYNELKVEDNASIEERLTRAFLITDVQSRKTDVSTSGATAICCLLMKQPNGQRILYSANVGDSRAILCCSKKDGVPVEKTEENSGYFAKRLSFDHRAEDPSEQTRIKQAGGFIARNRVLGILAVSRSFGDHGMKDFVTAQPYITTVTLDDSGDCDHGVCPFLILACDGVWDVMSDQQAVDYLCDEWTKNNKQPFENAAQLLAERAIEWGSGDNITVVVVFL